MDKEKTKINSNSTKKYSKMEQKQNGQGIKGKKEK